MPEIKRSTLLAPPPCNDWEGIVIVLTATLPYLASYFNIIRKVWSESLRTRCHAVAFGTIGPRIIVSMCG